MSCGCKDRQKMIASAARQVVRGNASQVLRRAQAVVASVGQDANRATRAAAARLRGSSSGTGRRY